MVLLVALLVLVIGVYPDPIIVLSRYAFFAMSPELQQFILLWFKVVLTNSAQV